MKLRVAMLATLLSVAALGASRASAAAGATEGAPCLSRAVGDALSTKLAAHAFDVLPPGWTLTDVDVERDHVDLRARDDEGRAHGVALRLPAAVATEPDGRGRWFVFVLDPGDAPLDPRARGALLDLAVRVDAAVPEDEALRVCTAGPSGSVDARSWAERGGLVPRWLALTVGGIECLLILAALVVALRRSRGDGGMQPRRGGARAWLLDAAIFVSAAVAIHAWAGASPTLWLDTINDQRDVRRCLVQGACTTLGEATSVEGLHHAAGWLDFLGAASFMGLGLDGAHRLMQALCAAGVALAASAARRSGGAIGGLLAAATATFFTVACVDSRALYNTSVLPFLGAVFLVVGHSAVEKPGPTTRSKLVLLALVGAVMASVHAACVLAGVSVAAIALLPPGSRRQKVGRLALGLAVFALATLAIGPASWIANVAHVLSAAHGTSAEHAGSSVGPALVTYGLLSGLALAAWWLTRGPARSLVTVALVTALPVLGASLLGSVTSAVSTNAKYLAHVVPSGAVLAAALVAAVGTQLSNLPSGTPALAVRSARVALPLLCALLVLTAFARLPRSLGGHRRDLTFGDAAAIPRELERRGWSYARVYRSLRSPDSAVILAGFDLLAPDYPTGPADGPPTSVYVAKVDTKQVPQPLPAGWTVAREEDGASLVLAFVPTVLTWDHFEACDRDGRCDGSGLSLADDARPDCAYCVAGMPPFGRRESRAFELRMRLGLVAAATHVAIVMPARSQLCAGTVESTPFGPASIDPGGRSAHFAIEPGRGGEVRLDWVIGSDACDGHAYSGLPPFFLEGDATSVAQLAALDF